MAVDWKKYGFIKASKYRTRIVESLVTTPKTPTQIANEINLFKTHTSTVLKELVAEKIVECLTPDLRRGKMYWLTREGKLLATEMQSNISKKG
ncbi:MAG: ArsR family transcriptional regulator [Candidatus Micrarchaeota archaeon]|nr:ArsR family transcriptional regulator [Candidatus Micrarchaeota archaeon]